MGLNADYEDDRQNKSIAQVLNKEKQGDVYLNVYCDPNKNTGSLDFSQCSLIHFSILVDVFGETLNKDKPIGYEFHLRRPKLSEKLIEFDSYYKIHYSNKHNNSIFIGKWCQEKILYKDYLNIAKDAYLEYTKDEAKDGNNINSYGYSKFLAEKVCGDTFNWPKVKSPNDYHYIVET